MDSFDDEEYNEDDVLREVTKWPNLEILDLKIDSRLTLGDKNYSPAHIWDLIL